MMPLSFSFSLEWVGIDRIHVSGYAHVADKAAQNYPLAIQLPKQFVLNDLGYDPDLQVITQLGSCICVGASVRNGGFPLFLAVDSVTGTRAYATINYYDADGNLQSLKWNQLTNISDNCYFIFDLTYAVAG